MFNHCKCGATATVQMEGQLLCSQHAFEKIKTTKGLVKLERLSKR